MTDTFATIRGSAQQLNDFIRLASAGYHESVYIRVLDDRVETLMQTGGRQVVSHCTFAEGFFGGEVSGDAEVIMPVGGSTTDSRGWLDYMAFAEGGSDTIEVTFQGEEDDSDHPRLASYWQAEGGLNTKLRLPTSDDDVDAVPFDHPVRWTPDDRYVSKECLTDDGELPDDEDEWKVLPTTIETTANIVREKVVEPADFADGVNYYPVTVEDGEFFVDVEGRQADDGIWGAVNAETVEGPDVSRRFEKGFAEVFESVEGPVELRTAPGGAGDIPAPLTIAQTHRSDRTIRHLIGAMGEE